MPASLEPVRRQPGRRHPVGWARRVRRVALVLAALVASLPGVAQSEPYVGVFAGTTFSESKTTETRLRLSGATVLDGTFDDVDFHNSLAVGLKGGYFFTRPILGGHVGVDLELHYTQPAASRQTVRFQGTAQGVPSSFDISIQHVDFEVYAALVSALYRVPLLVSPDFPSGRLQPYVGLGGGVFVSTMYTRTTPLDVNARIHDTDVAPGLKVTGGLRAFLLPRVAVFAEYRFLQSADFTFEFKEDGTVSGFPVTETARDRSNLTQHQAVFGISVHW